MTTKSFKTLYKWLPKSRIKASEGLSEGQFPFYTSSADQKKWVNEALFSGTALVMGTGGSPSIHYVEGKFSVSTDCVVAESNQDEVNTKYTYYFLKTNIHLLERGFKGSGLEHISKTYIENIDIPYPPMEEQNKIVNILDTIQSLIENREKSIDYLDKLIESVYLEMFGIKNPDFESWEYVTIDSFKKDAKGSMRTGPFGSALTHDMFKEEGEVAVLGIDNAVDNIFRWKKKRFISLQEYSQFEKYKIEPRDIIITIMGTVGRSAVIPEDIGLAINTKHLAAITVDEEKCNPYYLSYSIHSNQSIQHQVRAKSRGAVMDGLNLSLIKELKLKNAPIALQNTFEVRYKSIQVYKNRFLDFRQLLETLLNSLSQRLFSGQSLVDIGVEVEALIAGINPAFPDSKNDISTIKKDQTFLQNLIDRLESRDFKDIEEYNKAKYIIFRIMKEDENLIRQVFDKKGNTIKLETL